MANVVEIAIRGIDEATRVFEQVGSTATQSMERAERSVRDVDDSIKNVSDLDVSTGGTERAMENASSSIRDVQAAIEETESTGVSFGDRMKSVFENVAEAWKEITVVAGTAGAGLEAFARSQGQVNATLDRVAISTGMTREELRELANEMADTTTSSAQQAEAFEMLVQRGIDTKEQFREIIPHISNLGTATGQDLQPTLESVERILSPLGQGVENVGDNIDQLGRIMLQTDIPLSSLERNLNMIPDELQALEWGLDEVSAGLEVFRDKGFTGREAVREFRRTVAESEGDMDKFLELVGLTADEWEEYQKKVEPQVGLTEAMAAANENNMTVLEKVQENIANLLVEYGAFADLASMLAPILMSMGPILKGVTTATKAFNLVLKMNPIVLVITSIVALIAVVSLLWKHWDTISQWLSETWTWIKEVAVELFGGLGEYFEAFWEWIQKLFFIVWEAITEFLVMSWEWIKSKAKIVFGAIGTFLTDIWEGIKQVIMTVWEAIKTFFSTIWAGIQDVFTTVVDAITQGLSTAWDFIKKTAETVWTAISDFFKTIWNGIKNIFMTVMTAISDFLSNAWNAISQTVTNIWNGIKTFFSTIWEGIKLIVTTYINTVKMIITTVFNTIQNVITTIWNAISKVTSTVWDTIVSVVTMLINTLKSGIETVFNTIQNIITTIWNAVKSVSQNVWNGIVSVVTGIINGFKSGIQSTFNTIKEVISTVWNAVKSVSSSVWDGIKGAISSIIDSISSTISQTFDAIESKVKGAWNGIKSATGRIWDGIKNAVKAPINTIIGYINGMINALNRVKIKIPKIPDWVPGIGGRGGGSIGFNIPNVPSLATGGVVSEPTLAVVGDAGRGNPEIIAPEKMLRYIINDELGTGSNFGNGNQEVIRLLKELIRLVANLKGETNIKLENYFTPAESTPSQMIKQQRKLLRDLTLEWGD